MKDLTKLERQLLQNIADCEYNEVNGNDPENADETTTWYYPEYLCSGMEENQVKAIVTSLQIKGYVWVQLDEEDNQLGMTKLGFSKFKETK